MNYQKLKGNMILLLTAFIWGVSFIAQSKGVEEISPMAFNGIRSVLGGVVLLPVIAFLDKSKKRKGIPIQKPDKTLLMGGLICGVCLCVASTLQTIGMVYTSPGKSGFLTALYMVIVPILGLCMGKKPRPVIVVSVLIALGGLYLMCMTPAETATSGELLGDLLTVICAFVFALHILAIDYFSPRVDGVKLACLQFFVCGILNLIAMVCLRETPSWQQIFTCWASIGYSGILSCGVAYTLQIVGQKYTDPTSASILMSLESVFATLTTVVLISWGWQLTGGALSAREIWGCVLMFGAILLVQLPEKKAEASPSNGK